MKHRLERQAGSTYQGGLVQFAHFTRASDVGRWAWQEDLYARTISDARESILERERGVLEWEDQ